MQKFNMIIDGQQQESGAWAEIVNPAVGTPFAKCAEGSPAYLDRAVDAARRAFPEWSALASGERQAKVHAIADLLEKNMPELMELVTSENGKPLGGLNGIGSGMEVGGSIAWTHHTADLSLPPEVVQDADGVLIEVHHKPLGVVGSITPWNWPLLIAVWHTMPAILAGNTVVIKPSPTTPLATIRMVELANTVLPAGVLNIVTGGAEVGEAMSRHPGIDKITFTGSSRTGRAIMREASANLARLTLELSGNDAGIILPDVNVKAIAPQVFAACFHNNGQTCAALKRLFLHESIHDQMAEALVEIARSVKVGNGLEEGVELGPLQNEMQLKKVAELAQDARNAGARFLCGGKIMERQGYFFEPTIVTDIPESSRLADEEPFGPLVPLFKYTDEEEALARANASSSGLGGSVWSADVARARKLALRLECGTAWVNDHGSIQPNMPFGGVKQSGFGVEFGPYGLMEFTAIQSLKIVS